MTKTYTIATLRGVLMATAPDGDEAMMKARLADSLDQLNVEDREGIEEEVRYTSGLTLFEEEPDEDEWEVVYSGTGTGWLEDEAGRMQYEAAARRKT
jgi:hypothetical protein